MKKPTDNKEIMKAYIYGLGTGVLITLSVLLVGFIIDAFEVLSCV